MKKKLFLSVFSALLVACLFAGCSSTAEPKTVTPDQFDAFFDNPKDYVKADIEISGQVVSEPQSTNNTYTFDVMTDQQKKTDFIKVTCPDTTDVQLFDIVTIKGKVSDVMTVTRDTGTTNQPVIEATEVTVTDSSGRQNQPQGQSSVSDPTLEEMGITPGMSEEEAQKKAEEYYSNQIENMLNGTE